MNETGDDMKLAQKMKLFFFPIVITCFVLIMFFSILIFHGYLSMVYELDAGKRKSQILELLNPLSLQNELVQETYEELTDVAKNNSEKFRSRSFLKQVDEKLFPTYSYLILKIEDRVAYIGTEKEYDEVEEILPPFQEDKLMRHGGVYVSEPEDLLIRQVSFRMYNGERGSAYIISELDTSMKHYRNILIYIVITGFVMLVLTNMALSKFIKVEFIEPLQILEDGIQHIKCGNLEEDVPIVREDEIGSVARSFNEMRDRVKTSIDDRLHYEEENRILISNISHDLKTPITAIKGYVEGIMDGVATTPEMMDRYIKTIYTKAEALDVMINELAVYSKIDSDTIPYNFKKLNLDSFFGDCIDDFSFDLEDSKMELTYFNYCSKDVNVIADAEQLKRVITNIIMNAIKYNDKEKGRINIRLRQDEDYVQVEIEDNGMGIDEKDLPFIFNRMYRADASRNSRYGGTGLGLSIAKKIIEEHGGTIWAKSRKNTGTMIIFTLNMEKEGENEREQKNSNH